MSRPPAVRRPRTVLSFALLVVLAALAAACAPAGDAEEETAEPTDTSATETQLEQLPHGGEVDAPSEPGGVLWTDPNEATRDELLSTPGLDEAMADALIAGRPYADMTEVDAVLASHLDETGRETVYGSLWMPIDLNTASAEEILLIPGVGERMRHEFEEYRPYRAIEEFRREIGKYVDETEVARLERYVEIR